MLINPEHERNAVDFFSLYPCVLSTCRSFWTDNFPVTRCFCFVCHCVQCYSLDLDEPIDFHCDYWWRKMMIKTGFRVPSSINQLCIVVVFIFSRRRISSLMSEELCKGLGSVSSARYFTVLPSSAQFSLCFLAHRLGTAKALDGILE